MNDISQIILQQAGLTASAFPPSSRYNGVATATMTNGNGEPVAFLRRRIVPQSDNFYVLQQHVVKEGERLDNIAAEYIGDPEKFWQLCDANNVLQPGELTEEPGTTINITLPQGIIGSLYA
jgi:hypothetical protein